jgi:ABC-type transport system involved in multi-copper enzyme maturation permease subunit
MSTTTEPTSPPTGTESSPLSVRPIETAPSQVLAEGPALARTIGFAGLFGLVLGAFVIITNQVLGPRWVSIGGGYLFAAFGIALMLYHAVRDGEPEIRRMYGMLAALWLILGIGAAVVPGPVFSSAATKEVGYNLLPWGVGFGFLSLLFAIPFARHETDPKYHSLVVNGLLAVGAILAVGSLIAGLVRPDFLVGPGIAIALLGLGFLCAYLGQVDTSEGIGYQVAFAIGIIGGVVALYAIGRAAVPTLLYEGSGVLRKPNGDLDKWKVAARVLVAGFFAALIFIAARGRLALWFRATLAAIGVAALVVLGLASFQAHTITIPPEPFLVPNGVILIGLGIVYLAVSMGVCSDNQFVTLTRRELASYFLSPIGYLVLGGMALAQWGAYWDFLGTVSESRGALPEPIVRYYFVALLTVFALVLEVPALTMRLLSEEKRTGSLEVLLTAPVNESPIVLSKFLATWIFFMISWLPAGLFLIALRVVPDTPFDYRPLLSFYVALAAQGVAFIAIGLFFSSLTRNQIVAAVLMFVVMVFFVACYLVKVSPTALGLPSFLQVALGRLSFIHMWQESLSGQLPLRDVLLFLSIGILFLFLSVKVLETRKWS